MVGKIIYKNQKLIFQEGDKEKARTLLKDSGITPEDVKDWFKAEYNNPCCSDPQLELRLLEDLRIAFFCKNCQSWRFRDNLNASKNQFEDALVQVEEDLVKECLNLEQDKVEINTESKVEEPTESEPIRLDRRCVVCGSDSWIRLSKSRTAAIKCKNCNHVELQSFVKR
jgi:DNA-directed RNA polymerase subunit RPC12/RpoP